MIFNQEQFLDYFNVEKPMDSRTELLSKYIFWDKKEGGFKQQPVEKSALKLQVNVAELTQYTHGGFWYDY